MRPTILFSAVVLACYSQTTGPADTKGVCSPANAGDNNTFNITCGISKQQGDALLKIINKILANQLDPDAVMKKLDEILYAVNPNLPVKTYFCNGQWKTVGPSATAASAIDTGGGDMAFREMIRLNNFKQYTALLKACLAQIQVAPEWLTPRLFCGLAYLAIGERSKAKEMLAEFDSKTGPAYDVDACRQMSGYLHNALR